MFICSLNLINFKKHAKLAIEFSENLNILYGNNSAGKSCVIEAIKWIFFGEGTDIRKEGTKKTTVSVTLDNGTKITKIRSASINAYELEVNGETKRFDSVGKSIPDEIKEALGVRTIDIDGEEIILNIANQISLPFLLSESATFRSKLFNKLTGSNLIDKTLQSFNKDILKISRESKLEAEHLEQQKTSLSEVTQEKDKLESLYNNFKKEFDEIKSLEERYSQLNTLKDKIEKNSCDLQEVNNLLKEITTINPELLDEIKNEINKLDTYTDLYTKIRSNNLELEKVEKELSGLKIVDIDTVELKKNIERLENMKGISLQLIDNERVMKEIERKIKEAKEGIIEGEKKYKEILKKYGKCPTCKSDITDDVLKDIKL